MNNTWFRWILVIIWCGILFTFTELPTFTGEHTRNIIESNLGSVQYSADILNLIIRKFGHVVAFGGLGILFYYAIGKKTIWLAWLLSTLYASFDEWHQSFVAGRGATIYDVYLDSIASLLLIKLIVNLKEDK